jgi:hypothetical protein
LKAAVLLFCPRKIEVDVTTYLGRQMDAPAASLAELEDAPYAWLTDHQPAVLAVLFSQNKTAVSNQPAVLFSQNKPATSTLLSEQTSTSHQNKRTCCEFAATAAIYAKIPSSILQVQ